MWRQLVRVLRLRLMRAADAGVRLMRRLWWRLVLESCIKEEVDEVDKTDKEEEDKVEADAEEVEEEVPRMPASYLQ